MAEAQDIAGGARTARSGRWRLAAALHFDVSTPNFMIQEAFAEFDVPWRNDLVAGWNPIRTASSPGRRARARARARPDRDRQASLCCGRVPQPLGPRVANELHSESIRRKESHHSRFSPGTYRRFPERGRLRSLMATPGSSSCLAVPRLRWHFITELAPRANDPGYWPRLYSLEVRPEHIENVDGLIVLRPWVTKSTFASRRGRPVRDRPLGCGL